MELKDIILKILQEPVYMVNDHDEIVIRSTPDVRRFYAKAKGKKEYQVDGDTKLVTDTIFQGKEISRDEYEKY